MIKNKKVILKGERNFKDRLWDIDLSPKPGDITIDEVASVLAVINHTYDGNILHARFSYTTNLGKYQMSVGATTTTCGQHMLDDTYLVGIMDGSLLASSYNGFKIGSMAGSTFDKMLVMQFRPMLV